jgi:hypothetical protein
MSDVFDYPSESDADSESELECQATPQDQRKRQSTRCRRTRAPRNEYCGWFCEPEVTFEFDEYLSLEARTDLLKEKIQDRLSHEQPACVLAYAALVDSSHYSGPEGKSSFTVKFYIQTRNTTVMRLQAWLGEELTPIKGGLCNDDEYNTDMERPAPWVVLPLYKTLKLNNAGRAAKKVIARYFHSVNYSLSILNAKCFDSTTSVLKPFTQRDYSASIHCILDKLFLENQGLSCD